MEIIGGYQLIREIGGWDSIWFIYSAHRVDDPARAEVVLKTCQLAQLPPNPGHLGNEKPAFLLAAEQQKEAAAACPTIAPIYASGTDSGQVYSISKRYSLSLQRLIESKVAVTDDALEHLTSGILQALADLQKRRNHGHGNLKPANVFLEGHRSLSKATPVLTDLAAGTSLQTLAQDIHGLGHLLHQVIRQREIGESFFPLQLTEEWNDLGRDAPKWLHCCNRFLDPALDADPDPVAAARLILRRAERDSAGGALRQHQGTIKAVGSSRLLQSLLSILAVIVLLAGGFYLVHRQQTNVDDAWLAVQSRHQLWLSSLAGELKNPAVQTLWRDSEDPQISSLGEKIPALFSKSPLTAVAVMTKSPLPDTRSATDSYPIVHGKGDPDTVETLQNDLETLRTSWQNYLPAQTRENLLRPFAGHLAAAKWPVPDSLAAALAFDPTQERELGSAISRTLPLLPRLLANDAAPLRLLDRLAAKVPLLTPLPDPRLAAFAASIQAKAVPLLTQPANATLWATNNRDWRWLKKRSDSLDLITNFLRTNQPALGRSTEADADLNLLSFPEPGEELDDDFGNLWVKAASQYVPLENQDAIRRDWQEKWAVARQHKTGIEQPESEFKTLLAKNPLIAVDQTTFANLSRQLLDSPTESPVATPPPGNSNNPNATNPAANVTAEGTGGYRALLEKTLAQLSRPGVDVVALTRQFQTDAASFATSISGADNFLADLALNLTRKAGGWRPQGFPNAVRPKPADPALFNIPLPGGLAFPFRLITPQNGQPFFLAAWEVPVALLKASDLDPDYEGPRFWVLNGGQLAGQPAPLWRALLAQGPKVNGQSVPYVNPAAAAIPGGPQNWRRLPATFINPGKAREVATRLGVRLPTLEEWKTAYAGVAKTGWVRGTEWKKQTDYVIQTVGTEIRATLREGVALTYPAVFPSTRAREGFNPDRPGEIEPAATQGSLYFRPTFSNPTPESVQDLRGNVSEIVSNGNGYAVCGASALSSPNFTGVDGPPAIIPQAQSYSDVGFRFAVNAEPESGASKIPQLFTAELQRLAQ